MATVEMKEVEAALDLGPATRVWGVYSRHNHDRVYTVVRFPSGKFVCSGSTMGVHDHPGPGIVCAHVTHCEGRYEADKAEQDKWLRESTNRILKDEAEKGRRRWPFTNQQGQWKGEAHGMPEAVKTAVAHYYELGWADVRAVEARATGVAGAYEVWVVGLPPLPSEGDVLSIIEPKGGRRGKS